jgi:hypothetical protein
VALAVPQELKPQDRVISMPPLPLAETPDAVKTVLEAQETPAWVFPLTVVSDNVFGVGDPVAAF